MGFRGLVALGLGILPASRIKNFCFRLLGFKVDPTAIIRSNIFLNVTNITLGVNSVIRYGNIIRNVSLVMEKDSTIGAWNWITGANDFKKFSEENLKLHLGCGASITSRHYLDCSGGIDIGDFSLIAGVRSTFFSHQIDVQINRQTCEKISIGTYSLIGSDTKVLPGSRIGSRSLVGMGSVVTGKQFPNNSFIAGTPAKVIRRIEGDFFSREKSVVDV
jgi:acetyltransferase-like isoleucine patch superfamily enzyme